MPNNTIRFPVERTRADDRPLILAWYRCAGGCGKIVSSSPALCIACAVEDR